MKRLLCRVMATAGLLAAALLASTDTGAFTPVSGTISASTIWTADASPYHVVGDLAISAGATLTIEPGTVIKFADNYVYATYLLVNGTLIAQGTSTAPITFTTVRDDSVGGDSNGDGAATTPAAGQWVGILVYDGGNATLDHVAIRYAGAYLTGSAIWTGMGAIHKTGAGTLSVSNATLEASATKGVWLSEASGNVTIANSIIRNHAVNGILVESPTATIALTANAITNNTGAGIFVTSGSPNVAGNTISGNSAGAIGVIPNSSDIPVADDNVFSGPIRINSGTVTRSLTWSSHRTYAIMGDFGIASGATLTIAPGTVVKFADSYTYATYLSVSGSLNAAGTAGSPITFTTMRDDSVGGDSNSDGSITTPLAGQWVGILVNDGGNATLDHAVVRYAGAYYTGSAIWTGMGAIYKTGPGTLTVSNSTLETSSTKGIWLSGATGNVTIANSTIRGHAANGILVEGSSASMSFTGNLIRDNTGSGINVYNSSPSITGNTATANTGYGLFAYGVVTPSVVSTNVLDGNTSGPIGADASASGMPVNDDNLFSGPIRITGGSVSRSMSWSNNRTYSVAAITVDPGVTLTISAGRVIKLSDYINVSGTLNVEGTALQPVYFTSTADDTVGGDSNGDGSATSPALGQWVGLLFGSDGGGSINHAVLRYAGAYLGGSAIWTGMGSIYKSGAGTLSVSNSTLETSSTKGIWLSGATGNVTIANSTIRGHAVNGILVENSTATLSFTGNLIQNNSGSGINVYNCSPAITANTVTGNTGYGLFVSGLAYPSAVSGNMLDGNTAGPIGVDPNSSLMSVADDNVFAGPIRVVGGSVSRTMTWSNKRAYSVAAINVDPGITLNIPAGSVIKLSEYIYVYGTLNVAGTALQPVTFTSIADDSIGGDSNGNGNLTSPGKGDWSTLFLADGSNASIDHAVIRYAGAYMNGSAQWTGMGSIFKTGAGSFSLTNSLLETSATKGIWINGATGNITVRNNLIQDHNVNGILFDNTTGTTVFAGNTIQNNLGPGIQIYNSSASVTGNTINANTGYGIYLAAANAKPIITRNTISNNPYGVYADGGSNPIVGGSPGLGNDFLGNTTLAVVNTDAAGMLNARYNWWGTPAGPTVDGVNGVSLHVDFGDALPAPFASGAGAGLVSLWSSEGNALDSVGSNHGSTMNGTTYAAGLAGQAFSFDAVDDYVNIPDSGSIHFGPFQPMSMAMWIKRTSTNDSQLILVKRPGCGVVVHYSLQWYGPGDWLGFYSTGGVNNGLFTTADKLPLNAWTHFAVSFNGSTVTMYIDGLPVGSQAMSFDPYDVPLRFGGEPICGSQYFGGLLDEVRLYSRALSATEVAALSGLVPDLFSFAAQTGVALGGSVTSNPIIVTGISRAVPLSIVGGEYSVSTEGGTNWSAYSATVPATVSANQQVRIRLMASASYSTQTNAVLTIGGISATFSVTTQAPAALVKVVSRKTHGALGPFNLLIDRTKSIQEAVTVESRIAVGGHQIVFEFDRTISAVGNVIVTPSPAGIAASVAFAGSEVTITLAGVTDNQRLTVGLTGVNGATDAAVSLGFLVGDVNGSGAINAADISAIKARSGSDTAQDNFRFDLNTTGRIGATDITAAKARAGWVLP